LYQLITYTIRLGNVTEIIVFFRIVCDGGRILFVILRALTGDAISDKVEAGFHFAGMMILIGLIIFITINEISNLF